jgi:hypothetical protein
MSLTANGETIVERRSEHTVAEMLLATDLGDPDLVAIGRELAEAMSWQDSLSVVYDLKRDDFKMVKNPDGATLTIRGGLQPAPSLDVGTFRKRLKEAPLPDEVDAMFRRRVAEIVGR